MSMFLANASSLRYLLVAEKQFLDQEESVTCASCVQMSTTGFKLIKISAHSGVGACTSGRFSYGHHAHQEDINARKSSKRDAS